MDVILWFLVVQGLLGAFDMFYHHELKEKLPFRETAAKEMLLHGVRNMFYAVMFFSFGWVAWQGVWAWVFAGIIVVEVLITLTDFVEEDRTRLLPATERVTHAILTLNYGAIIAFFVPIWSEWSAAPTGFHFMHHGLLSWIMTLYALGVFIWGVRDLMRGITLQQPTKEQAMFAALTTPHQKILVTGGTGFIGKILCQHLIDDGHEVIILTRNATKAGELFHGRVTIIESLDKLHDDEALDAIINLAGEPVAQRWTEKNRRTMLQSRVQMITDITALVKRLKHTPDTLIQASAIGYYGLHPDATFDEESDVAIDNSFAQQVCMEVESHITDELREAIRVCTLRIGIVLEKDGGALRELLIPFDCGVGGSVGHGRQWWSWIHRDDVIGMILHLLSHEDAHGVFNATAPNPVQYKQFAKALGKAMKRPSFLTAPACIIRLLFGEMGNDIMLNGQKVLPVHIQKSGYKFKYIRIEEALTAIFK